MSRALPPFSRALLALAAAFALAYGALTLCGFRADAGPLLVGSADLDAALRGALYIGSHLGTVLLAPALVIGALLYALLLWAGQARRPGRHSPHRG